MSYCSVSHSALKLSHKQFRALLKKFRRKKKRQGLAQERDNKAILEQTKRENSPTYLEQEDDRRRNSQLYEEFEERERLRRHKEWLFREQQAQIQFKRKQEQLEIEKQRREEERKRILEEFEKQQNLENKLEERNKKIKSQKEVMAWFNTIILMFWPSLCSWAAFKIETLQAALSNLPEADGPWHNPIAPNNYNSTQDNKDQCQFFAKTGCCRFGDRCSRGHIHPSVSTTILIKGMFTHFSIDHTGRDDYDTDMALEYDDKETYSDFKNFYNDVLPEFKKFGKVVQFKVCSNHEPHLRGNVYIQYTRENEAVDAYRNFNGRYYAGKQLTCEFTNVIKWRSAICGLYFRKLCPKGINCNFLHVFKNPSNEFWEADRDLPTREIEHSSSRSSRSRHSREHSDRHSSHQSYSHDHHRDEYENSYRNFHHRSSSHRKSSESDSEEENGHRSKSSRHRYRALNESSHSNQKYKQRDSKARSHSPEDLSEDSETHKKSKKNKHKKKKKKRSKKRSSEESED